jgi:signal transduction histidine kinase
MKMVEKINSKTQDITIVKSRNNLTEVVDGVINELEVEFVENRIVIIKEYSDEGVHAFFDKTPTKEVFVNMFKNAIEAIEKEGIITVRINKKGKKAVVTISDNGIGITKENLEYVKSPFFTTKKLKDGNTGWGLYYCYDVMIKSDGNLEISSQVNVGTDIKLTFSTKK